MLIRFRLDPDFAVDVETPLTKMVNGYKQARKFIIGETFRHAGLSRALREMPQAVYRVMATGSEGGVLTVDVQ